MKYLTLIFIVFTKISCKHNLTVKKANEFLT